MRYKFCIYFCFLAKPKPLDDTAQKNKTVHVVETATMKLSGSKPYIYFKVKSPLRIPMTDKKPFNISVSVKGLQPIKIQWEKDQHELVIGSRYKTFDDDRRLLVESPFTAEDSGTYSASACNAKGCEVKGVQVMFYSKYEAFYAWINLTNAGYTSAYKLWREWGWGGEGDAKISVISFWRLLSYHDELSV